MKFLTYIKKIKSLFGEKQPTYLFRKGESKGKNKNIIFLLPVTKYQAGGIKVICRQSELISKLNPTKINSEILFPESLSYKVTWFEHEAIHKGDLMFDPEQDLVVLPEFWAAPHAKMLSDIGVKYAIYVQNGYSLGLPLMSNQYDDLKEAYKNASLILSISDDTTECIKLAFPDITAEIIRIYYSVDADKFKSSSSKENLITYMPRKLASHSKMVLFFLNGILPKNWKIQAIDGLNEHGVIDILSRSRIFLSFSEFEGCPLPPVEAALSGNQVVGYTGEGAKEYWYLPMFTEVFCGDVRGYVKSILDKITQLESNPAIDTDGISKLADRYSNRAENESIARFLNAVEKLFA